VGWGVVIVGGGGRGWVGVGRNEDGGRLSALHTPKTTFQDARCCCMQRRLTEAAIAKVDGLRRRLAAGRRLGALGRERGRGVGQQADGEQRGGERLRSGAQRGCGRRCDAAAAAARD